MNFLLKFVNFYIYSSLHIGLAAVALTYQTCEVFNLSIDYYYLSLVFAATVFIYCTHRIIGFQRMPSWLEEGRFTIIKKYKSHIKMYAVLGLIGSGILFFFLPHLIKFYLVIPAIFSVAYVLPIFKNKFRLRDFNYIKIFLIAIVWAYITAFIPLVYLEPSLSISNILLITLERALFVFAITIPFDVRDIEIDKQTSVNTIVHSFGIDGSKKLTIVLIFLAMLINFTLRSRGILSNEFYFILIVFYLMLILLTLYVFKKKSDYYFSGLLDGTMILSPLLIYLFK